MADDASSSADRHFLHRLAYGCIEKCQRMVAAADVGIENGRHLFGIALAYRRIDAVFVYERFLLLIVYKRFAYVLISVVIRVGLPYPFAHSG